MKIENVGDLLYYLSNYTRNEKVEVVYETDGYEQEDIIKSRIDSVRYDTERHVVQIIIKD
jgi:hypothetical protein